METRTAAAAAAAAARASTARLKLKDSCDSCARAKVKCSREHPTCRRCLRNALACHYSVARRGKAGAQHAEAHPPTQNRHLGPVGPVGPMGPVEQAESAGNHDHHVHHNHCNIDDLMYAEFGLSADFTPPPPPPPPTSASSMDMDSLLVNSGSMLMPDSSSTVSTLDPYLLQTLQDETDGTVDLAGPRLNPHRRNSSSTPIRETSSCSRGCGDKDDSMRVLLQTLQTLHLSYGDSTPLPGIDTILMTNTVAATNVAALFPLAGCRSRSGSSNTSGSRSSSSSSSDCGSNCGSNSTQQTTLQAMLALVCCNSIVDAYGWIVDRRDGGSGGGSDPANMEYPGHTPVAVGNFTLDGAAKHSVIAGLVLSELRRLDHIVDHIVERIMERMVVGSKEDNIAMDDDMNEIVVLGDVPVEVDVNLHVGFDMDMDAGSSAVAVTTLQSLIKRKLHTMTKAVHTKLDNAKVQRH